MSTDIYFLQFEVVPKPESDNFNEAGGAFVNCWVDAKSWKEARDSAKKNIDDQGWTIISVEEESLVNETSYDEDNKGLDHYLSAVETGEYYVFHTYPPEPDEDDLIN
jgi:hypothetical protein